MHSYLDALDQELSQQPGFKAPPLHEEQETQTTSTTDDSAGYIHHGAKRGVGYLLESTVDCKHGIVTGIDVYPANQKESLIVLRHLEKQQERLGLHIQKTAMDRGYDSGAVHRGLELLGIEGYIAPIEFSNTPAKHGFSYDEVNDCFICPQGQYLTYHRLNCNKSTEKYLRCYQTNATACANCPTRVSCLEKSSIRRRILASGCYPAFFRGHQRAGSSEYKRMMRLRKIWAEGSYAVLKREHLIQRIRKRGLHNAFEECILAAIALNLKRMVAAIRCLSLCILSDIERFAFFPA